MSATSAGAGHTTTDTQVIRALPRAYGPKTWNE